MHSQFGQTVRSTREMDVGKEIIVKNLSEV